MNTSVVSEALDPNVHLEQVFSHPGMSFDEEKGLLEIDGEATAALVQLIEEIKKTIPTRVLRPIEAVPSEVIPVESAPVEMTPSIENLPSLIDQGITSEVLSVTKKGRIRGAVGKILDQWKNGKFKSIPQLQKLTKKVAKKMTEKPTDKAIEEVGPSVPSINIWIKIGERMLPAPIMIWSGSTFETVRVGLEVRLRYSGIFSKKK